MAMIVPYRDFLPSSPFEIRGPNAKSFFVHPALIAKHSKRLDRTVNLHMKEAEERIIKIESITKGDIDDGTVLRFIEYAYTGDYTVPTLAEALDDGMDLANPDDAFSVTNSEPKYVPEAIQDEIVAFDDAPSSEFVSGADIEVNNNIDDDIDMSWNIPTSTSKKSKKKSSLHKSDTDDQWTVRPKLTKVRCWGTAMDTINQRKQDLWSDFISTATLRTSNPWQPEIVTGKESYWVDLTCHARMYVFSNQYECGGLAELALQKLRLTLSRLDPKDSPTSIVTLARYTYSHTQEMDNGYDRLRRLVIDYLVCHLEKVMADRDFKKLLRESEGLAAELLIGSMKRLD